MPFHSILFDGPAHGTGALQRAEPAFFTDLNLDQVIGSITLGRAEYDLAPFFYTALRSVEAVAYRHEILRDFEDTAIFGSIGSFAKNMRAMRAHLSQAAELHYQLQKQRWFLDALAIYCDAVAGLVRDLSLAGLRSRGLCAFRDYIAAYAQSDGFTALADETRKLEGQLAGIRYCLDIKGNRVKVSRHDAEADYGADVAATFEKFKQGAVKDYTAKFLDLADMDHIETGILHGVTQLYPEIFTALNDYCDLIVAILTGRSPASTGKCSSTLRTLSSSSSSSERA